MQIFMKIGHKKNGLYSFLCHWSMFLLQTVLLVGNEPSLAKSCLCDHLIKYFKALPTEIKELKLFSR